MQKLFQILRLLGVLASASVVFAAPLHGLEEADSDLMEILKRLTTGDTGEGTKGTIGMFCGDTRQGDKPASYEVWILPQRSTEAFNDCFSQVILGWGASEKPETVSEWYLNAYRDLRDLADKVGLKPRVEELWKEKLTTPLAPAPKRDAKKVPSTEELSKLLQKEFDALKEGGTKGTIGRLGFFCINRFGDEPAIWYSNQPKSSAYETCYNDVRNVLYNLQLPETYEPNNATHSWLNDVLVKWADAAPSLSCELELRADTAEYLGVPFDRDAVIKKTAEEAAKKKAEEDKKKDSDK